MRGYEEGNPREERAGVRSTPSVEGGTSGEAVRGTACGGRWRSLAISALVASALASVALLPLPSPAGGQAYDELEARIWVSGGASPVFHRGDRVSVYYRATDDAYVAVFHVDTDGIVRLLHPRVPDEDHYVRRDRTYRLRFARSSYWYVDDQPGVGYFFVVASYTPLDFSAFRYSHLGGGWDLGNVGRRVYQDPYLAMDDFVAALVPDWRAGGYALDFVEYNVDRRYDYPRFLCYDCHAFRPYRSWDPYRYQCHSFRLIVHTDPYFYPVSRYRGTRVVYTRPPVRNQPRFAFKERARGEPATPIFQRSSETDLPGVVGAERRRSTGARDGEALDRSAVPRAPSPGRRDAPSVSPDRGRPDARDRPSTRPDARRTPDRGDTPASAREPTPSRGSRGGVVVPRTPTDRLRERRPEDRPSTSDQDPPRPVLERRPPSRRPDGTQDRGSSTRPGARPSSPDAGRSPPGARPSSPGARPSAPEDRSRSPSARPGGREPRERAEPRPSEPRTPDRAPARAPRRPEPRQRAPDRGAPSTRSPSPSRSPSPNRSPASARSPSSGGDSRSPSARPRSGSSASPAPRGGGNGSRGTPQRRGRGRPPR